jgi:hypothetical protein
MLPHTQRFRALAPAQNKNQGDQSYRDAAEPIPV